MESTNIAFSSNLKSNIRRGHETLIDKRGGNERRVENKMEADEGKMPSGRRDGETMPFLS